MHNLTVSPILKFMSVDVENGGIVRQIYLQSLKYSRAKLRILKLFTFTKRALASKYLLFYLKSAIYMAFEIRLHALEKIGARKNSFYIKFSVLFIMVSLKGCLFSL